MKLLLIDNYDSFTWNLVHLFAARVDEVIVKRNDALSAAEAIALAPDAVVLSPGPGHPAQARLCLSLIMQAAETTPLLGVCLGHQAIGQALGGDIVRVAPAHGKTASIQHGSRGLFRGLNGPFEATRYHSLVINRDNCPADLEITAETSDGLIMGVQHRRWPLHGVQFHPESIMTECGGVLADNFIALAAEWNARYRASQLGQSTAPGKGTVL